MSLDLEPIFAALFERVSTVPGFVTVDRTLKSWANVPSQEQPALFQAQTKLLPFDPPAPGGPRKWLLGADLYLYANREEVSPGEAINPLLTAVLALFDPTPIGTAQTLGGLVQWARVEGELATDEGALGSQAVVIIPIRMLVA